MRGNEDKKIASRGWLEYASYRRVRDVGIDVVTSLLHRRKRLPYSNRGETKLRWGEGRRIELGWNEGYLRPNLLRESP